MEQAVLSKQNKILSEDVNPKKKGGKAMMTTREWIRQRRMPLLLVFILVICACITGLLRKHVGVASATLQEMDSAQVFVRGLEWTVLAGGITIAAVLILYFLQLKPQKRPNE